MQKFKTDPTSSDEFLSFKTPIVSPAVEFESFDSPSPEIMSSREKKLSLYILILSAISCGGYNFISFFPLYVMENYSEKINITMISVCIAAFELAGIFTLKLNIGSKSKLILGHTMMFVSNISLGMLSMVENTEWKTFYFSSMMARFIQGYGERLVLAACYQIIGSNYSENKTGKI